MKSFMILIMGLLLSVFLVGCVRPPEEGGGEDEDNETETQQEGAGNEEGADAPAGPVTLTINNLKKNEESYNKYTKTKGTWDVTLIVASGSASVELNHAANCVTLTQEQLANLQITVKGSGKVVCKGYKGPASKDSREKMTNDLLCIQGKSDLGGWVMAYQGIIGEEPVAVVADPAAINDKCGDKKLSAGAAAPTQPQQQQENPAAGQQQQPPAQ